MVEEPSRGLAVREPLECTTDDDGEGELLCFPLNLLLLREEELLPLPPLLLLLLRIPLS